MRNWGIVVTAFYAIVVLLLLGFGIVLLAEDWWGLDPNYQSDMNELVVISLIPTAFLVCGQVLLLFLSVDTSWRRLKPQRHARVTALEKIRAIRNSCHNTSGLDSTRKRRS